MCIEALLSFVITLAIYPFFYKHWLCFIIATNSPQNIFFLFYYLMVQILQCAKGVIVFQHLPITKLKLNCHKKVFCNALNFLPWDFLLIKTLDFEKTKAIKYITFKSDVIKVVLVFSISNFFINKISQGRKMYLLARIWL